MHIGKTTEQQKAFLFRSYSPLGYKFFFSFFLRLSACYLACATYFGPHRLCALIHCVHTAACFLFNIFHCCCISHLHFSSIFIYIYVYLINSSKRQKRKVIFSRKKNFSGISITQPVTQGCYYGYMCGQMKIISNLFSMCLKRTVFLTLIII